MERPISFRLSHAQAADIGAEDITTFNLMARTLASNILLIQTVNEASVLQNTIEFH